jgi:hypothetical protein
MPCSDVKNAVLIPPIKVSILTRILSEDEKLKSLIPRVRPTNVPRIPGPTNIPGMLFQNSTFSCF